MMTVTECTGNLHKDREIIRKNQVEIVNVKSRISEMKKNSLEGPGGMVWMAKENINEHLKH